MISALMTKLLSIRISIGQGLLALAAGALAVFAVVLKSKEMELHETRVDLLKSHLENEQDRTDEVIAQANERVQTSKGRYEEALAHFNSLNKP